MFPDLRNVPNVPNDVPNRTSMLRLNIGSCMLRLSISLGPKCE